MPTSRTETVAAPGGGAFAAHVVVPDAGEGPGILLLQEIFGVNDFLQAKADDLAALGYVVLCPDVFWRVEPGISLPHDEAALAQAFDYVGKYAATDDEEKAADLGAALEHLEGLPEVTGKVAAMGYCLGGLLAYVVAATHDPDAAVSYYGSSIADRLPAAEAITCPILFHFGGNDPYIPREQVDKISAALGDRPNVEIHVQDGAGHAFENFLAPQFHDPEAAKRSWPLTVDFLDRVLRS
jgi:carboxymethylenebutenolidase